jgi:HK97 family phage portal protein
MLHFRGLTKDGVWGLNPIQLQAQQLSVGLSVQASQKDTYEKGGNLDGILVFPNRLEKETRDKTVEGWQNKVGGIGGARTAILDNGATYQKIGISAADKMFLESKQVSGEEVARMFNVPLHLLQFPNNQSYASVEQLEIGFVNHCLLPISKMKEEEIEFKLLMPYEENHYCKYNLNGLMRGDFAGRMEGYRTLHSMGLPLNRILKLEDMDSVEGGDISLSPLNMIGTDRLNEYHFSNNKTQPSQSTGQGGADNKKRGLTIDEVLNG